MIRIIVTLIILTAAMPAHAVFVPDYNPPPKGQPHGTGTR
jgi:hypothetical protein